MVYRVAAWPGGRVGRNDLRRLILSQRLRRALTCFFGVVLPVTSLVVGVWLFAFHGDAGLLVLLLQLLLAGGIGVGYLVWWLSNLRAGQMSTPTVHWRVVVCDDTIQIRVGELDALDARVPLTTVEGVVRIPECAEGFHRLRHVLESRGILEWRPIGL